MTGLQDAIIALGCYDATLGLQLVWVVMTFHGMQLGYSIYRQVLEYYSGEEDAYDMRKAMPRDVGKKSVIPLQRPVRPEDLEWS